MKKRIGREICPCYGPQTTTCSKVIHSKQPATTPIGRGCTLIRNHISVPYGFPLGLGNMQFLKCNILSEIHYAQLAIPSSSR